MINALGPGPWECGPIYSTRVRLSSRALTRNSRSPQSLLLVPPTVDQRQPKTPPVARQWLSLRGATSGSRGHLPSHSNSWVSSLHSHTPLRVRPLFIFGSDGALNNEPNAHRTISQNPLDVIASRFVADPHFIRLV